MRKVLRTSVAERCGLKRRSRCGSQAQPFPCTRLWLQRPCRSWEWGLRYAPSRRTHEGCDEKDDLQSRQHVAVGDRNELGKIKEVLLRCRGSGMAVVSKQRKHSELSPYHYVSCRGAP